VPVWETEAIYGAYYGGGTINPLTFDKFIMSDNGQLRLKFAVEGGLQEYAVSARANIAGYLSADL